jgi:hypothetical protein
MTHKNRPNVTNVFLHLNWFTEIIDNFLRVF